MTIQRHQALLRELESIDSVSARIFAMDGMTILIPDAGSAVFKPIRPPESQAVLDRLEELRSKIFYELLSETFAH